MRRIDAKTLLLAALVAATLALAGCARRAQAAERHEPATVVHAADDGPTLVILTARAAERLGVRTTPVARGSAPAGLVVPYSALLYGTDGTTWVYTSPEPLTFTRVGVEVVEIDGDLALLSAGPPPGTDVVQVGAAELFGTEFGVGH